MIELLPHDARPLWAQIRDGVRDRIATGTLAPGAAVASVREMAQRLRVNPATVAKAYRDLTDEGLLEVRRGEGTFVADLPAETRRQAGRELLAGHVRDLVDCARALGLDWEETRATVETEWTATTTRKRATR
ncbi:MAG: GntR family transcriptional regulator [Thermoanaerobaculia bacterium]